MNYTRIAALMLGATLGLGTLAVNAQAQDRDDYGAQGSPQILLTQWGNWNNGTFDHGYRDGQKAGREDAQKGKSYRLFDHGTFTDSHNQTYRDGYQRGYREAYGQNGGYRNGSYGNGGYYGNGTYRNSDGSWRDSNGNWHRNDRDHRDDRWRRDHDHDRDNHWRDHDRDHDHDGH